MSRVLRGIITPLGSKSTYLRAVHLLLGAVLLTPFFLLDTVSSTRLLPVAADFPTLASVLALIVLGAVILVPPVATGILGPTRAVEVTAAAALLDVDLPAYLVRGRHSWNDRWRTVVWFGLHLAVGGAVGVAVLIGVPVAGTLLAAPFQTGPIVDLGVVGFPAPPGWGRAGLPPLGLLALIVVVYLAAAAGALLARLAPTLLGPSASARVLELEQRAERLTERNRLARELHDSVGHALTITTLQAAAAQRLLDADPEFTRGALAAIESAGRAALTDLDHVLGLLRDSGPATGSEPPRPQPTLRDLRPLLDKTGAAGVDVQAVVTGSLDAVPAAVSREAYRIVQEGLTNALRYAGKVPVSLYLTVRADELALELANPIDPGAAPAGTRDPLRGRTSGGRGLRGMRERIAVLNGRLEVGVQLDCGRAGPGGTPQWRISARIPLRPGSAGANGDGEDR